MESWVEITVGSNRKQNKILLKKQNKQQGNI